MVTDTPLVLGAAAPVDTSTLVPRGALWRLNEWGYLPKLTRISSVSGGSITAAALGFKWAKLAFDGNGVGRTFDTEVVQPIRALAGRTIDEGSVIRGIVLPGSIADKGYGHLP